MKKSSLLVAACLIALLPATAHTAPRAASTPHALLAIDGNKILAEIDRRAAAFEDQTYSATMQIYDGSRLKKELAFEAKMKGLSKQLLEFTAPGDVAGMKVLMENAQSVHIYMPEFKKVRQVALHAMNQGFLGSEFTFEDMTQVQLSPFFDATFVGKSGSETTLELVPKKGTDRSWTKLEVVIDGTKGGVTTIRYYDKSNKPVREQLRTDWVKIQGISVPTTVTVKNLKTGNASVIKMSNLQVNRGVSEGLFSRRNLLRG